MSKTHLLREPLSNLQTLASEHSSKTESILAPSKDLTCLAADNEPVIRASDIAPLRAFFELLDQWDRNGKGE